MRCLVYETSAGRVDGLLPSIQVAFDITLQTPGVFERSDSEWRVGACYVVQWSTYFNVEITGHHIVSKLPAHN